MTIHQRTSYTIFADYSQFYICDGGHPGDWSDLWNDATTADRLVSLPDTVVFGTDRNFTVPVEVIVHDAEPATSALLAAADHAVLCGITLKTNDARIAGCTDYLPDAARLDIQPGTYGVLYALHGLKSVTGLEGDDRYDIHLWPCATAPARTVLKRHPAR
jgi:hypothetical protein